MILLNQVTFLNFILFDDDATIIAPINTDNKKTANIINMEILSKQNYHMVKTQQIVFKYF